jgi:hypothetical protein
VRSTIRTGPPAQNSKEPKTATDGLSLAKGGKTMTERVAGISLCTKRIIALAAMALIPLFLANLITLRTAEQLIMKTVFERNRNLAENIADDIDQMFAEKIRMLKIAADNTDINSMDPASMLMSSIKTAKS